MESVEAMSQVKNAIEKKDIAYIHSKARKEFEILSGNSILLTGANGFLGFYLIKSILAWNDNNPKKSIRLTALSTFRDGIPEWVNLLKSRKDFAVLKKDITKYTLSSNLIFDYIIHGASYASPTFYRQYPVGTINANVLGLYNILEYMLRRRKENCPVSGLLFFSSSEVYGDPTKGNIPTPETYRGNVSCTGPRACYDESKRFCETLCINYVKSYGLSIKSARPCNNYGPGMKITDGRVIADFSKNILENKDIVMFSDGSPLRTFCYVADATAGYFKVLMRGRNGEAYNIGIEKPEISMINLAKKMVEIGKNNFSYTGKIVMKKSKEKDYLTDNPNRRCPIIDKARRELGYDPQISIDEGLLRVLSWYKDIYYKV